MFRHLLKQQGNLCLTWVLTPLDCEEEAIKSEKIREIQNIYQNSCTRKAITIHKQLGLIEAEMEATHERDEILQFIKNSQARNYERLFHIKLIKQDYGKYFRHKKRIVY